MLIKSKPLIEELKSVIGISLIWVIFISGLGIDNFIAGSPMKKTSLL